MSPLSFPASTASPSRWGQGSRWSCSSFFNPAAFLTCSMSLACPLCSGFCTDTEAWDTQPQSVVFWGSAWDWQPACWVPQDFLLQKQRAPQQPLELSWGAAAYSSCLLWCMGCSYSAPWPLTKARSSVLVKAKPYQNRTLPSMHGQWGEAGQPASNGAGETFCLMQCRKPLGCDAEPVWARIWQWGKDGVSLPERLGKGGEVW